MRTLVPIVLAAVLILGGGVTWKVMADRADHPAADLDGGGGNPNVVMPANYQPTGEEQAWIDSHTATAGVWVKKFGDYRFVLVTMGEKPTGGYAVEFQDVTNNGSDWAIDLTYLAPGPGDMVTQVISYPYGFVKIKADGSGLRVRDVSGDQPVDLVITEE